MVAVSFRMQSKSNDGETRQRILVSRRCALTLFLHCGGEAFDHRSNPPKADFGSVKNWPDKFFGDSLGEAREQALARLARMKKLANAS